MVIIFFRPIFCGGETVLDVNDGMGTSMKKDKDSSVVWILIVVVPPFMFDFKIKKDGLTVDVSLVTVRKNGRNTCIIYVYGTCNHVIKV